MAGSARKTDASFPKWRYAIERCEQSDGFYVQAGCSAVPLSAALGLSGRTLMALCSGTFNCPRTWGSDFDGPMASTLNQSNESNACRESRPYRRHRLTHSMLQARFCQSN
jgi:hypothetical protein